MDVADKAQVLFVLGLRPSRADRCYVVWLRFSDDDG